MDRRTVTHDEALDDLPGYLLDDLEPERLAALETHLAGCPACRLEHDQLALLLGELGTLAPPVAPPPALRARLLAALDSGEPALSPAPVVSSPAPDRRAVGAAGAAPRLIRLSRRPLLAVAAVLLLALVPSLVLYRDLAQTRARLGSAEAQTEQVREVLSRPAASIPLVADSATDAYGTLYIGESGRDAVMLVDELPPTPADHVYQVWLVQGGVRTSAGLFTVNQEGAAQVLIQAPQALSAYQSMGITVEPGPHGSSGPTGARVVSCPLNLPTA